MEKLILSDPLIEPDSAVLENTLGENYKPYAEYASEISARDLAMEWHYYNDGKSWLCKILYKKKNLAWLSVWDTGFRLTFYFPARAVAGIEDLEIDREIKQAARESKPVGKTYPLILFMDSAKKIPGALKLLEFKMKLK